MITQKAKYGFKALLHLARVPPDDSARIEDIAEATGIPRKFLETILLGLKNDGLIASRRGRYGGYTLIKDPATISIGHVLRAIDGPIAPLPCLSKTAYRRCADCTDERSCAVRKTFGDIYAGILLAMEGVTLADMLRSGAAEPRLASLLAEDGPAAAPA